MVTVLSQAVALLRRINLAVEAALRPLITVVIVAMLITVIWTVAARLTGFSAAWTEKVMLILLPSLAFLVAPIAYRRAANVALDMLHDALPKVLRPLHSLLLHVLILGLLLIALDLSLRKVGLKWDTMTLLLDAIFGLDLNSIRPFKARMKIPVLGLEWRYVFMVLPACITLMVAVNVEMLLRYVIGLFDPDNRLVRPVRSFEDAAANRGE
ncbi:TRAP transporter small permease subunit [Pelagibius litoralis]|uniref:TRAP transporter small permease protein n=1 Tax=Pelagibius litoralis TaxID=374515 RepID=A0A967EYL4_9PROT|nr:TRAP transporter small permease subunit [Pelagibius litoralis]NIA69799.1 TRAP transporter small permease subunit [Pelagibius litoralis]